MRQTLTRGLDVLARRRLLQSALAGLAVGRGSAAMSAQSADATVHRARLLAVAEAVLPASLGAEGLGRAVDRFLLWLKDYREGAERDHGYGVTAVRVLPPSPAARYPAQLDDLDTRAGGALSTLPLADRQRIVTAAIDAAGIRGLPARPTGGHVATDLMAHYFHGAGATDLAYGRAIGRGACRDLAGSEARPAPLTSTRER